ncbi:MAG: SDR family NAD(P)-dependent oxidoreductase [Bacteroidales bacterium]
MKDLRSHYGPWAAIAGSASGLGEAFARNLAAQGLNLVMIDKDADTLTRLSDILEKKHFIETRTVVLDLSEENASRQVLSQTGATGCHLLIYNAAYSHILPFLEYEPGALNRFIDTNCRTPLRLAYGFSRQIRDAGRGGIVLMSSLAGLFGTHLVAPYSASKAFNLTLAEALHYELRPYGIDVMSCLAGATATPAFLKTNPRRNFPAASVMDPQHVADAALKQLGRKTLYIPGYSNRLTYFLLQRLMPRRMAAGIVNRVMGRMYKQLND